MQQLNAVSLGTIAAPVIPSSGVRVAVAHEALNRREIDAGVEQVAGTVAAHAVRSVRRLRHLIACRERVYRAAGYTPSRHELKGKVCRPPGCSRVAPRRASPIA